MSWWLFVAYSVVVCVLAAYALWLKLVERGLNDEERELCSRSPELSPLPLTGGRLGDAVGGLALMAFALASFMALIYAPTERTMGSVQRIFYFHVPSAWTGFFAFFVVFVMSVVCLFRLWRSGLDAALPADRLAAASAELGVLFTSIVLITGPIWAKPVWYVWWTWDARLTSTLIMWLIYVGYLMLRSQLDDEERRARLAAVVGVLGFINVPVVYFSIRWWRTLHPQPVMGGGSGSGLEAHMMHALFACLGAFTMIYLALLVRRFALAQREAVLESWHRRLLDS